MSLITSVLHAAVVVGLFLLMFLWAWCWIKVCWIGANRR